MSSKYLVDESGLVVVNLAYSDVSQVKLQQPKWKHIKSIQRTLNQIGTADEATAVSVAISVLAVEPKLTLEQLDNFDPADVMALGEALTEFRFFRETFSKL